MCYLHMIPPCGRDVDSAVSLRKARNNRLSPCKPCPIFCPSSCGGIRWLTRVAGGVSNGGALLGIPIPRYVLMWRQMWPTERERLSYLCNPRSLPQGTSRHHNCCTTAGHRVPGSAPQWKPECKSRLSAEIPIRRYVPTWHLHSLPQGAGVT